MATPTTRHRNGRRARGHAKSVAPTPARIRIPNEMVEAILSSPPERPTMDRLQAQLLRLNEAASSQADRILVTHNEDSLDLLRDWCTRLIADNRLSSDPQARNLVASASRVIGFMDGYETRAQREARHALQQNGATE